MEELFDFSIKNLADIEIDATKVSGYIALTMGYVLKPHTKTKISQLGISIAAFREILPKSPLPVYMKNNMATLHAICSQALSIKIDDKIIPLDQVPPIKLDDPVVDESVVETEVVAEVAEPVKQNPFGHETNTEGGVEMVKKVAGDNPFGYETNANLNNIRGDQPSTQLVAQTIHKPAPAVMSLIAPPIGKPESQIAAPPVTNPAKRSHHKK